MPSLSAGISRRLHPGARRVLEPEIDPAGAVSNAGRFDQPNNPAAMFEIVEHTADLGLRVRAPTLEALLADAARGLFQIITGDLSQIRETDRHAIEIEGADPAYLLFDWLNELLFAFESRRMLFARFEVVHGPGGLHAVASGERYDPGRHTLAHEVKAVTYHALDARATDQGWEATVIVDI
jgi:SHS2 domain-containing protein